MCFTYNENDNSWKAGEAERKVSQNLKYWGSILRTDEETLGELWKSSRGSFANTQPFVAHTFLSP